jgi:hypothetical protein
MFMRLPLHLLCILVKLAYWFTRILRKDVEWRKHFCNYQHRWGFSRCSGQFRSRRWTLGRIVANFGVHDHSQLRYLRFYNRKPQTSHHGDKGWAWRYHQSSRIKKGYYLELLTMQYPVFQMAKMKGRLPL